jgi:hypothetical protein
MLSSNTSAPDRLDAIYQVHHIYVQDYQAAATASFAEPEARFRDSHIIVVMSHKEGANEGGWSSARRNFAPRTRVL